MIPPQHGRWAAGPGILREVMCAGVRAFLLEVVCSGVQALLREVVCSGARALLWEVFSGAQALLCEVVCSRDSVAPAGTPGKRPALGGTGLSSEGLSASAKSARYCR